ncbi:MAG: beta-propeller fold lactonase family protein [Bacteroidota bacterium]
MRQTVNTVLSLAVLSATLFSCQKQRQEESFLPEKLSSASKLKINPRTGFVYTMSNEISGNRVLRLFQKPNGTLAYADAVASGGNGTDAGLGSQGSVTIDASHNWLFAVNPGSNTVSSFRIHEDGSLTLANTAATQGTMPISVTVSGDLVYIVNSTSSNIAGFRLGSNGALSFIDGSNLSLSQMNAGPAQISFTPDGGKLIVTEKMSNKISTYMVSGSGVPFALVSTNSAGTTPFGFAFAGNHTIVVTEAAGGMPNASTVSAYSVNGATTLTGGPIHADQTAACWATATSDGRYAYVTNTGSNTISSFSVAASGKINLLEKVAANTGATPIDITLSGNEFYLYNVNAGAHSITQFRIGGNPNLNKIGEYTNLPAHAVGIAAF